MERGHLVGKYRLLRELGRGGMGVVYLAEDARLLRKVALKVLHPALTLDSAFVARFESEAQAIATLTHPGIVRIHAFEEVDGSHLIDMEFIDGRSLDLIVERGLVGHSDAMDIIARVLEALAACHARGLVHRDIKPSNILIAYDGRVLLSDFGLARSCAMASVSAATSSCFIGTPKYAPPESWDRATPTPAGDVYSAGLVMLELLSGRTPFDGDSPLEIMRKTIASLDVPVREFLPDASEALVSLMEDMLRVVPGDRPADAGVAYERLQETPEFAALPKGGAQTMQITPPAFRRGLRRLGLNFRYWRTRLSLVAIALTAGVIGYALASREAAMTPPGDSADSSVAALSVPSVSPDVADLAAAGGHVLFIANAADWRTLWSYNTATGISVPIWPSLALASDDRITAVNATAGGIVGVLRTEAHGVSLFGTDGTAEAGTIVLAYAASAQANLIELLEAQDGTVYFNRIGGDETFGLWETDGTIEGTRHRWGGIETANVTRLQVTPSGGLYFASRTTGAFYYWPHGASAPYSLWPDLPFSPAVGNFMLLGEQALVEADAGGGEGRELWIASPSPGSMRLLYTFTPGAESGLVNPEMTHFGDGVVFTAQSPTYGRELWFSDGTEAGTHLLYDVNPGAMGSNPYRFTEAGGLLYFSALTAEEGQELWVSDGTEAGTRMVRDIYPGLGSTDPYAFCPFNGGLLFTPHDPIAGEELWFTDGTPEGTQLLFDCMPGPESGAPHGTLIVGERAYFGASYPECGRVLWETDGTPEGTRPLFKTLEAAPPAAPTAVPWITFKGQVYMVNASPEHGTELWVTDQDTAESRLVRDIWPGREGSYPHNFHVFQGQLYFAAADGIHGIELWRTDGTREGTVLAFDSCTGPESGNPADLISWGDNSFAFSANGSPGRGRGIYFYDPGLRGFKLAGDSDERGAAWKPADLVDNGDGWLLFSTQNAAGDTTLWRTNGNATVALPALGRGSTR